MCNGITPYPPLSSPLSLSLPPPSLPLPLSPSLSLSLPPIQAGDDIGSKLPIDRREVWGLQWAEVRPVGGASTRGCYPINHAPPSPNHRIILTSLQ